MSQRLIDNNPDNQTATWDQIKQYRDQFEQGAITLSYGEFDADEISLKRMELALAAFDSLPTLVDGKLTWKLYDNTTVELTKVELQDVYDQIRSQIAIRSSTLHYQAAVHLAQSSTLGTVKNSSNWGI